MKYAIKTLTCADQCDAASGFVPDSSGACVCSFGKEVSNGTCVASSLPIPASPLIKSYSQLSTINTSSNFSQPSIACSNDGTDEDIDCTIESALQVDIKTNNGSDYEGFGGVLKNNLVVYALSEGCS